MKKSVHPENAFLIRYLDGELPAQEYARVRAHLEACADCRERQDLFGMLSQGIAIAVCAPPVATSWDERADLVRALEENPPAVSKSGADRVLRRFGWGMAIAATLALVLLLAPGTKVNIKRGLTAAAKQQTDLIDNRLDINGETFIALPYSNPDLPLNAPRIVEMEIPASSLAEAGIAFAPPPNGTADGMVAANVLLGIDGQPLGLHVLGSN